MPHLHSFGTTVGKLLFFHGFSTYRNLNQPIMDFMTGWPTELPSSPQCLMGCKIPKAVTIPSFPSKKKTQKIHQYHYRPASSCASQSPSWKHPGLRKGLQDMSLDGSVHPSHDSVRKLRNLDSRVRRFLDSREKMPTVGQLFIQTSWNSSRTAMDVWYSWFIMIHDINWLVRWIFHQKKSGRSGCIQDRLLWQSIQAGTNVKTSRWMAWGNDWGKNHGIVRGWCKVENPSKYFLQSIVVIQDAALITETTQASYSS